MIVSLVLVNNTDSPLTIRIAGPAFMEKHEVAPHADFRTLASTIVPEGNLEIEINGGSWNFPFYWTLGPASNDAQVGCWSPSNALVFGSLTEVSSGQRTFTISVAPPVALETWMSHLDEDASLADITMPGTHDSGTYGASGDRKRENQCQTKSIAQQLALGIRWFDLRLGIVGSDLEVFHSIDPMNVSLSRDILPAIMDFLTTNTREVVVLCIKEEGGGTGNVSFDRLFRQIFESGVPEERRYEHSMTPKLSDVRGRIALIRRDAGGSFGMMAKRDWPDDGTGDIPTTGPAQFSIQDAYKYGTDYLSAKWKNIAAQLTAAKDQTSGPAWYINFTSASRAPITDPVDIAIAEDHQGINFQLFDFLARQVGPFHAGTMPMDFPETPNGLMQLLVSMNRFTA